MNVVAAISFASAFRPCPDKAETLIYEDFQIQIFASFEIWQLAFGRASLGR
jgi:hypothetical protein